MQDRFKFRLYDKAISEMVYDVCVGFIKDSGKTDDWVCADTSCGQITYRGDMLKDIVLMQSTGSRDKNGKLIYEGDILRSDDYPFMSHGQDNYYAEVCWDDESASYFYYTFKNPKFNDVRGISTGNTGDLSGYAWEVIGNIYENPELLEVK